jgi:hypothetical protein
MVKRRTNRGMRVKEQWRKLRRRRRRRRRENEWSPVEKREREKGEKERAKRTKRRRRVLSSVPFVHKKKNDTACSSDFFSLYTLTKI